MRELLDVVGALADSSRLRVLHALRDRELCVCQIVELLGLAPSTVSKHISILRQARLVESRKQGRWIYCRLADDDAPPAAQAALRWALEAMGRDAAARDDARRLRGILKQDPEDLCRLQAKRSACCSSAPATPAAARWPKGSRATSRAT